MPKSIAIKDALNQAYRKQKVRKSDIEHFTANLGQLLARVKHSEKRKESEENFKNLLSDFLKDTYYKDQHEINTYGRTDLVIHNDKSAKSPVGVLLEVKRPTNKGDMVSPEDLNAKAMHELMLYYFRQKDQQNNDLKYCIITNIYEWYIFDAAEFFREFEMDKQLKKEYHAWKNKQKESTNTDYFYQHIASAFVTQKQENLNYTYINLHDYESVLQKEGDQESRKLIMLYKLFSPEHLLKESFINDSNSLDRKFYNELLHIIGLTEVKEKGKKLIERKKEGERDNGSILENTISVLKAENRVYRLRYAEKYGNTDEERHFNVALELTITWLNRILFLKLLEAQLINYHNSKEYAFLNQQKIHDFDDLNSLFFKVLALRPDERSESEKQYYSKVPYLNSSLFEPTDLEYETIFISNLENRFSLLAHRQTVLKDAQGKALKEVKFSTLEYLFRFLDAYDFSSEGGEEVQEENKTLINASVLGLIFEKINGYKDGSFFTPGFITMYMSRETIRKALVQKFNEAFRIDCANFEELKNYASSRSYKKDFIQQSNGLINSLTICDPAVGSGHFLVSALNEILSIKSELGILADKNCQTLPVKVTVVNDELMVMQPNGDFFVYQPTQPEAQRIQETLFHEKETLIESCLFGVDVNENSVKICRLRLWIELLKNAYYTQESNFTELETLPNIDINIKAGNSLLYRYDLQEDLSEVFKSQKFSLRIYKDTVKAYKSTYSKEAKRELMRFIREIKDQFRTSLTNRDPIRKRMSKLRGEIEIMENPSDLFGDVKVDQKLLAKKKQELAKLEQNKADIESNKLYEGAFEWRFEFPEVLDEKGDFVGFDIVIGNPPYVDIKSLPASFVTYIFEKFQTANNRINLFSSFIELSQLIVKDTAHTTVIIPTSLTSQSSYRALRKLILDKTFIEQIIRLPNETFGEFVGDVKVDTMILALKKSLTKYNIQDVEILAYEGYERITEIKPETADLYRFCNQEEWLNFKDYQFSISTNFKIIEIITKCEENTLPLVNCADFSLGLTPYDKYKGHSKEQIKNKVFHANYQKDETFKPLLLGNDVKPYIVQWNGNTWISYGDWLGAPRQQKFFTEKRILVKQIIDWSSKKIWAAITDKELYNSQNAFNLIPREGFYSEYLLALLNSRLMTFYHQKKFLDEYKSRFQKILIKDCKQFPIKKIDLVDQEVFIEKVNSILIIKGENETADTSALEAEIDQMVYLLYELTEEEIKVVEGQ